MKRTSYPIHPDCARGVLVSSFALACMSLLFGLLACTPTALAQATPPSTMHGKVVAYSSGTAFALLDATDKVKRIKLTGVDAPERKQRFAAQARALASQWLSTAPIDIAVDATDKEQRIHGRVAVSGRDIGLALIEAGLAWCDPSDEAQLPPAVRATYRQGCEQARSQRRGLWQDANPTPPWEYRKLPEFDPLPGMGKTSSRSCRQIGYETVQCDDGTSYRTVGNQVIGSDGTVYSKRGNTLSRDDGTHYTQRGTSVYGSDGTVCRSRGRQTDCF
jgi:endonuclease YncB( thermonuclease family)